MKSDYKELFTLLGKQGFKPGTANRTTAHRLTLKSLQSIVDLFQKLVPGGSPLDITPWPSPMRHQSPSLPMSMSHTDMSRPLSLEQPDRRYHQQAAAQTPQYLVSNTTPRNGYAPLGHPGADWIDDRRAPRRAMETLHPGSRKRSRSNDGTFARSNRRTGH